MFKAIKRIFSCCLAFIMVLMSTFVSLGMVAPLPGPGNPLIYDDFNNGGKHTGIWANWYCSSGIGSWAKTTVDGRYVGRYTQTPVNSNSEAQFTCVNAASGTAEYTSAFYGYKYLSVTMKNPGYTNSRIKIELIDNYSTIASVSGGYISVPDDWTIFNFDISGFTNVNMRNVTLRITLKQATGIYEEILIDDIRGTCAASGTQPALSVGSVNSSTGSDLTNFYFDVTYTDTDNQKPMNVQVVFDDTTAIEMNEVDRGDFTYSDGKQYTYSTKLAIGTHSFYFRAADGSSDQVATASQNVTVTSSVQIVDINDNTTGTGNNQFQYAGTWIYESAPAGSYQQDQHSSSTTNDFLTFKFVGTSASLNGAKDPSNGIAAISIDGGAELSVDTYAASRAECVSLYTTPILANGTHILKVRVTGTKNASSTGNRIQADKVNATTFAESLIESIDVCQAGYSAADYKCAYVTAVDSLTDLSYQIMSGTTPISSGAMKDEGIVWGKRVYSIDFSSVTATGTNFTVKSNNVSSYVFPIQTNMWNSYKDEMTAFYRLLRENSDTTVSYPAGYSTIAPSQEVFHPAGLLDDAASEDGSAHYDLTGSWQDAGDYGKYTGNQWVGAQIAIAYLRHASNTNVNYDNDDNGIPDLIDEAKFGSEYLIKFANLFNGAVYDLPRIGGFRHPEKVTDNIAGTSDDRRITKLGIGGSAKGAATLAATARAINYAIANNKIASEQVAAMTAFSASCQNAAITLYNYAAANPTGPLGSYTRELNNTMLFAEVELYLLTGSTTYKTSATNRTMALTDITLCTNYWSMTPLALAEFYTSADAAVQTQIQTLLKKEMDYFVSSCDDTPYGTLNEFSDFGVNEPLAGYIGDALRYNELFPDPEVMRTALKGLYWIMGNNPWNISWVSGFGTDYVDFLHSRLDEDSSSSTNRGIVIPGAMVSGPIAANTLDPKSSSPWYIDRGLNTDDLSQWRYNEYSISINIGLLYSIIALTDTHGAGIGGAASAQIPVYSPKTEDLVTGDVKIFAKPSSAMTAMQSNASGTYADMAISSGIYTATIPTIYDYYVPKRYFVKGTDAAGKVNSTAVHFRVAPALPNPANALVYDNFLGGPTSGTFGRQDGGWQNWYTSNGSVGSAACTGVFTKKAVNGIDPLVIDGRNVGSFYHNPASTAHSTRFQPWHDKIDTSGYRYISITMRNTTANTQVALTGTGWSGSGWITVPTTWTTYTFDLNAVTEANKKAFMPYINLKQTVLGAGTVYIDDVSFTNTASGTAPTLTNTSISATSGVPSTLFTFNATYTDADNQKPFKVQVITDGVIHDMTELEVSDVTYADGKQYTFTTTLAPGTHSYYFRTTDTTSNVVSTTPQTGPTVSDVSIIVDNTAAEFTGTWNTSTVNANKYGTNYSTNASGTGADKMRWRPALPSAGSYSVYYWLPNGGSDRAPNAPFTVYYNGGSATYTVNEQPIPGGQWILLGTHSFAAGTSGYVELTDNATGSYVIGDAIKFESN